MAKTAAKNGVGSFVYTSAAAGFPGIPHRYISSKRYHKYKIKLTKGRQN
jgi:hypothetical protein